MYNLLNIQKRRDNNIFKSLIVEKLLLKNNIKSYKILFQIKMKNLRNKIQLKIQIPKQNKQEESKTNIILKNKNNNKDTISHIINNIYISGYLIGKNFDYLKNNNFTHVINCSLGSSMENRLTEQNSENEYQKLGIKYLPIFLRDDPEVDIIFHFFNIIDFIESDKEVENKKILFHCIEGISRAPTMFAGYIMWKNNLSVTNAIELLKSKRHCVDINLGFNIQLQKWENYLFSSPKKIHVFKLNPNIRLLEEEKELNVEENYLVKIQYKLFYINNIYKFNKIIANNNEQNNLDIAIKNLGGTQTKYPIFNVYKDRTKQFIKNVIKYDKSLLKNDFSSFVEIK